MISGFLILISFSIIFFRILRNKRAKFLASLHPVKDSQKLLWYMYSVEFPFLSQKAFDFVLFRALAVPSITRLLFSTKQALEVPWKRMDETDILIKEMLHHHVDSNRGGYALRRINAIHSQYKIPNDEFIYILCLYTLLPSDFASSYGYRKWTKNEQLAAYTVWHDVGVRMGFQNIPKSIEEMRVFKSEFESKNFKFDPLNHTIAETAADPLLFNPLPKLLRPFARLVMHAVLDEPLRSSIGFPEQPRVTQVIFQSILRLFVGTFVAVFMPPRPVFLAKDRIEVDWSDNPAAEPDKIRPLKTNIYEPSVYRSGYRLAELGSLSYGKLGIPNEGSLMCPFKAR